MAIKKGSGVKVRTVRGGDDDDGITIDRSGKPRNKALDEGRGPSVKKKKKIKTEKHETIVVEDNKYKAGQDPKPKKKKARAVEGELILGSKSLSREVAIAMPAGSVALKKKAKGKATTIAAVEEYVHLPAPVDEYDAETRRIFEQLIATAQRLEEQMEDRIYNKDVYALNTIYSQIREVIADLRATRDISAQISELEAVVMRPYQQIVAQGFTDIYFHMMGAITKFIKNEDVRSEVEKKLKNTLGEAAAQVTEEYPKALDRMRKVLI